MRKLILQGITALAVGGIGAGAALACDDYGDVGYRADGSRPYYRTAYYGYAPYYDYTPYYGYRSAYYNYDDDDDDGYLHAAVEVDEGRRVRSRRRGRGVREERALRSSAGVESRTRADRTGQTQGARAGRADEATGGGVISGGGAGASGGPGGGGQGGRKR